MDRYSLERVATPAERVLGAGLVLVLAFFVGFSSYRLWKLAFTTHWLDPFILFLATLSAIGSLLLVRTLFRHLSQEPRQWGAKGLRAAAWVMIALGFGLLVFALYPGNFGARQLGAALGSIAMGSTYLAKRPR